MSARLLALLFALALLLPTATAFSTTQEELLIAYPSSATPVVVASGELTLNGLITRGLLVGGATAVTIGPIPHLTVAERGGGAGSMNVHHGATIEISSGGVLWSFEGENATLDVTTPYGIALALPEAPLPSRTGAKSAGFILGAEAIRGEARWDGDIMDLVPMDATVTIRAADGRPVAGWHERHTNGGVTSPSETDRVSATFQAEGAFAGRIVASILAGGAGETADLALGVSRATDDRFAQTVELLDQTASAMTGGEMRLGGGSGALSALQQMSSLLNGALLIVPSDPTSPVAKPSEARWGDANFRVGTINLARGDDMGIAWTGGQMRIQGEPDVALGRDGFAVEAPATIWIFPILSFVLWLVAAGAIAYYFVKRPPKGRPELSMRMLSLALYVLVLFAALVLWDRSFAQTFGTSALDMVRTDGLSSETIPRIGVLAMLEFAPWSIAGLFFALPVRIAAGVGLRYLGRGKSFKGAASAAGLIVLVVVGPTYALWCFNLVWARAADLMGG